MSRRPRAQRGFLVIVAAVLIVIIGFLGAAITFLYGANIRASTDHNLAARALFVAEAGLEFGTYEWSVNGNTTGAAAFGGGNFSFNADDNGSAFGLGNPLANPNHKHIVSTGVVVNASRTVEAIVESGGGGQVNLTNNSFETDVVAPIGVPDDWDMTAPGQLYTAPAGCAGSNNAVGIGYPGGLPGNQSSTVGQNLGTACNVTGASTFRVDYQFRFAGATNGNNRARLRFRLIPTSGGPAQSGWVDIATPTGAACSAGSTTISVPGNRTVTRFEMHMEVRGNQPDAIVVDELQLTPTAGAGCVGGARIIFWREAFA